MPGMAPPSLLHDPPGVVLSYYADQCTGYLAATLTWVKRGWGNAAQWYAGASKTNKEGLVPVPGAIAVFNPGGRGGYDDPDGHVALVTGVSPNWQTFSVSEMNYTYGPGKVDQRTNAYIGDVKGFIYPPGGSDKVVAAFSNAKANGAPPPVVKTYTAGELAGGTGPVEGDLGFGPFGLTNPVSDVGAAITGVGTTLAHTILGVVEVAVGLSLMMAGVVLMGIVLVKSPAAGAVISAAGQLKGPAGVAGKVLSSGAPKAAAAGPGPAQTPPTPRVDSGSQAAQDEERAALQREIAAGSARPKPGAANRARAAARLRQAS